MDRFGFNFENGGFRFDTRQEFGTRPVTLQLDRRNAAGTVQATYTTTVPADFPGGWIYWNTPATTLNPGVLTIFTSFMRNALTQQVDAGAVGDAADGYPGGQGYVGGAATTADLSPWSLWNTHPWDFQFRVQQRNPACP
jgi:hypothetical protein